eukprot:s214_g34.t1
MPATSRWHWALPDFSRDCQMAVGTAGLQSRLPDRSGHCRTLAATARSQRALPDFSRDRQIAVGTAGLQSRAPGYRLWINGRFAWHKRHPEMSFHFLQMMTRWFGSKHVELTNTAITLCRAMRYQGVRDLTLPLANGLLGVLPADMFPRARWCALELLKDCQAVYPDLDVKLLLKLLEAVMSWKEREVRAQVRKIAAFMLEAMMKDDEAFALANINITSMALEDQKGNTDEAAAKSQKLIGLRETKVRS